MKLREKFIRASVLLVLIGALVYCVAALATYATKVYMEQGGDTMVVDNGGTIEIQNGGTLDLQSGGTLDADSGCTIDLDGTLSVNSGGIIDVTSGGDIDIESGGSVDVASGGTIAIASGGSITQYDIQIFPGTTLTGVAKTANYSILAPTDCTKLFTNRGVTSATEITFTLPGAVAGFTCSVAGVVAGATVNLDAGSGDLIYGLTDTAADKITCIGVGYVSAVALDATNWAIIQRVGTWSDTN